MTAGEVGDRALVASAAAVLCLAETLSGRIDAARGHHVEAAAEVDKLSDAELAPRLDAVYHLVWAETYLEHYAKRWPTSSGGSRSRARLARPSS